MSEKYNALLDLVGKGSTTYADRMAALPAMDTFFLRRSKDEVKELFPVTEKVCGPLGISLGLWPVRMAQLYTAWHLPVTPTQPLQSVGSSLCGVT